MKTPLLFLAGFSALLPAVVLAQESPELLNAPAPANDAPKRTEDQLEQLLGPIALYPDALIAIILPASTNSPDIVLAARFLSDGTNSNPTQIDGQAWDDSVKALAHYPEVVKWMDENLEWTKQLGEAFVAQPADVMKTVQRLRERARAVGALTTTSQQRVVVSGEEILIEPAQEDVIYVPRYDPAVVYWGRNYSYSGGPFITFGLGLPVGGWLAYDCDWRTRAIWVGRHRDGNHWHPTYAGRPSRPIEAHAWHPSPHRYHSVSNTHWSARTEIVRPRPVVPNNTVGSRYPGATPSTTPNRNGWTPNHNNNNNNWNHDRHEGLLRGSDGREIRRPNASTNPTASDVGRHLDHDAVRRRSSAQREPQEQLQRRERAQEPQPG